MIHRVLVCPLNYDHPQRGLMQAFSGIWPETSYEFDYLARRRSGASVAEVNAHLVQYATRIVKPDWIWLQVQETDEIRDHAIMAIRDYLPNCVLTHWTGDMRETVSPYLASICKATHATLASSKGQLQAFRDAGAPIAEYLQIGVDWEEDVLGIPEWTPPFRVPEAVFCGNYYGERFPQGSAERLEVIRAIRDAGIDIGVVGKGWPADIPVVGECGVKQQHHVYKRAKVALSISHFNNVEGYYSDRQLIAMASGTCVVAYDAPVVESEFYGVDFPSYVEFSTPQTAVECVQWMLSDDIRRDGIGREGRAAIMRGHTWYHRILGVLPLVERIQGELQSSSR